NIGDFRTHPAPISLSHADAWNALISRYIVTMPLTGDACVAMPSISDEPPLVTAVSSAIMAKVGDAARASASATLTATPFRRIVASSDPPEQPWLIASRSRSASGTPPL